MSKRTREELIESLEDLEKHHDIGHWLLVAAEDILPHIPSPLTAECFTRKIEKIVNTCCADLEALVKPYLKNKERENQQRLKELQQAQLRRIMGV